MMSVVTKPDIDLISGDFWGTNPHEAMAWMRANEPVYWDGRVWAISKYEDVKQVSKRPELFSNAGGIRPDSGPVAMMIDMDDPEHLKRRKLVNRGFTPRRVKESEAAVRKACDEIIDAVCAKGECDFVNDVAAWLPMIMIGDALGVAPDDRRQLLDWSDGMMKALTGAPDSVEKATEAFVGYQEFATDAIAARRTQPTDDLMSVLVHAEVDGDRLNDDELIHESLLILIGGDETTRHTLSGGTEQVVRNRDQWDALVADPSLLPGAIEEMLRWTSPVKNMCRTLTEDTDFHGTRLRAGEKMLLLFESANFDESVFENPDQFDIRRDPNSHLAFGFGTHFCLGNQLARLELSMMTSRVLQRLPDLRLADEGDVLPLRPANFVSGLEEMPMVFTATAVSG